jgi:hypothetical protein
MLFSIAGSKGDEIRFSTAVQPNPCGKVTTKHRSEQVLKFSLGRNVMPALTTDEIKL